MQEKNNSSHNNNSNPSVSSSSSTSSSSTSTPEMETNKQEDNSRDEQHSAHSSAFTSTASSISNLYEMAEKPTSSSSSSSSGQTDNVNPASSTATTSNTEGAYGTDGTDGAVGKDGTDDKDDKDDQESSNTKTHTTKNSSDVDSTPVFGAGQTTGPLASTSTDINATHGTSSEALDIDPSGDSSVPMDVDPPSSFKNNSPDGSVTTAPDGDTSDLMKVEKKTSTSTSAAASQEDLSKSNDYQAKWKPSDEFTPTEVKRGHPKIDHREEARKSHQSPKDQNDESNNSGDNKTNTNNKNNKNSSKGKNNSNNNDNNSDANYNNNSNNSKGNSNPNYGFNNDYNNGNFNNKYYDNNNTDTLKVTKRVFVYYPHDDKIYIRGNFDNWDKGVELKLIGNHLWQTFIQTPNELLEYKVCKPKSKGLFNWSLFATDAIHEEGHDRHSTKSILFVIPRYPIIQSPYNVLVKACQAFLNFILTSPETISKADFQDMFEALRFYTVNQKHSHNFNSLFETVLKAIPKLLTPEQKESALYYLCSTLKEDNVSPISYLTKSRADFYALIKDSRLSTSSSNVRQVIVGEVHRLVKNSISQDDTSWFPLLYWQDLDIAELHNQNVTPNQWSSNKHKLALNDFLQLSVPNIPLPLLQIFHLLLKYAPSDMDAFAIFAKLYDKFKQCMDEPTRAQLVSSVEGFFCRLFANAVSTKNSEDLMKSFNKLIATDLFSSMKEELSACVVQCISAKSKGNQEKEILSITKHLSALSQSSQVALLQQILPHTVNIDQFDAYLDIISLESLKENTALQETVGLALPLRVKFLIEKAQDQQVSTTTVTGIWAAIGALIMRFKNLPHFGGLIERTFKTRLQTVPRQRLFSFVPYFPQGTYHSGLRDVFKEVVTKFACEESKSMRTALQIIFTITGGTLNKRLYIRDDLGETIIAHILKQIDKLDEKQQYLDPIPQIVNAPEHFWLRLLESEGQTKEIFQIDILKQVVTHLDTFFNNFNSGTMKVHRFKYVMETCNVEFLARCLGLHDPRELISIRDEIQKRGKEYELMRQLFNTVLAALRASDLHESYQKFEKKWKDDCESTINSFKSNNSDTFWGEFSSVLNAAISSQLLMSSRCFLNVIKEESLKGSASAADASGSSSAVHTPTVKEIAETHYQAAIERFRDKALNFWQSNNNTVADVLFLFSGVAENEIEEQLVILEQYLFSRKSPNKDRIQRIKHTRNIQYWYECSFGLQSCLNMLTISIPNAVETAITTIINSVSNQSTTSFLGFSNAVNTLLKETTNKFAWAVIIELGNGKELFTNLSTVWLNENLDVLIDAVEDNADSMVQPDTVSDLLKVQKFLAPFARGDAKLFRDFFTVLHTMLETQKLSVAAAIKNCAVNIQSLVRLFNSMANRSELTKTTIANAVSFGKFELYCNRGIPDVCLTLVRNSGTNICYSSDELQDLRSRALLISVADVKGGEGSIINEINTAMKRFVAIVDALLATVELGKSLIQQVDNFKTIFPRVFQANTGFQGDTFVEAVKNNLDELTDISIACTNTFHTVRKEFSELNFFLPAQLWQLYAFFSSDKSKREKHLTQIFNLLSLSGRRIVLDDLTSVDLWEILPQRTEKDTYKTALRLLGELLQRNLPQYELIVRETATFLQLHPTLQNTTDILKESGIAIVIPEENVNNINVVLSFYVNEGYLPESHQLLLCNSSTTEEEVKLMLNRTFIFEGDQSLHCISGIDLLEPRVQQVLADRLMHYFENSTKPTKLLIVANLNAMQNQICDKFKTIAIDSMSNGLSDNAMTSLFRFQFPNVVCVTAGSASYGKTQWINSEARSKKLRVRTYSIFQEVVPEDFVQELSGLNLKLFDALHLDIGLNTIIHKKSFGLLNDTLFQLIVLGTLRFSEHHFTLQTASQPNSQKNPTIFIELANTVGDYMKENLSICYYLNNKDLSWDWNRLYVSKDLRSPMQVVCNYLKAQKDNTLATNDLMFVPITEANPVNKVLAKPIPEDECQELLRNVFEDYSNQRPGNDFPLSFGTVNVFVNVLANQLRDFAQSSFFTTRNLKDMAGEDKIHSIKTNLLNSLITVALDFALKSVQQASSNQNRSLNNVQTQLSVNLKAFSESNHMIVAFQSEVKDCITCLYLDQKIVPDSVKELLDLQESPQKDFVKMTSDQILKELVTLVRTVRDENKEYSKNYAHTAYSLVKMALILLRIRAREPVVIMGETGCGKTSLVRLLAEVADNVDFRVLNIHAGVGKHQILEFLQRAETDLQNDPNKVIWAFFDEINTSSHLGLLTDIVCRRTVNGIPIHRNLVAIAACNPYRKKSDTPFVSAGLTIKSGDSNKDPLTQLVYRVYPLQEVMFKYIWDYGALTTQEVKTYIQNMVGNRPLNYLMMECLIASQGFAEEKLGVSSVSLRDANRCLVLFDWFKGHLIPIQSTYFEWQNSLRKTVDKLGDNVRALILSLCHCYYTRLASDTLRKEYQKLISEIIVKRYNNLFTEELFRDVLDVEQNGYLTNMELPEGTALNVALLENVFVLLVCILNKIPVFLVGKPGCSKSLAMQLIRTNLRGTESKNEFFKKLPQVYVISFQGSESSTSEGILAIFDKTIKYQEQNPNAIATVLLDEVGLAEISKHNPLKVLHSMMEPPEGATKVAIVGISNWTLDSAKMNRAIHLSRPDLNEEDLLKTAIAIQEGCKERTKTLDNNQLRSIASAYFEYYQKQSIKNFHGLRDYYSLIKGIVQSKSTDSIHKILLHAIDRNFGGNPDSMGKIRELFLQKLGASSYYNDYANSSSTQESQHTLNMIYENLEDSHARHLLVISTGDTALRILQTHLRSERNIEPVVIYGSRFEADDSDEYRYRVLSRIILCMESGQTLILKDLKRVYSSLYDMLNQNYSYVGGKRHCRIALGAHSNPMCFVHENFRCIVLLDSAELEEADPPFLNRFEKQLLSYDHLLDDRRKDILGELQRWAKDISEVPSNNKFEEFEEHSMFAGFSDELLQSAVISVVSTKPSEASNRELIEECKQKLLSVATSDGIIRMRRSRVSSEGDSLLKTYFSDPRHVNFQAILAHCNEQYHKMNNSINHHNNSNNENSNNESENIGRKVIGFTFDSVLSTPRKDGKITIEKISAYKSESHFSEAIRKFFFEKTTSSSSFVLQCDASTDGKYISVCKYIIDLIRKEYVDSLSKQNTDNNHENNEYSSSDDSERNGPKHCIIIIHLNRELHTVPNKDNSWKFDFMSGWDLVTFDTITSEFATLAELQGKTAFQIIEKSKSMSFRHIFERVLLWCFTCIKYPACEQHNVVKRVKDLSTEILKNKELAQFFEKTIGTYLAELPEEDWQVKIACDPRQLRLNSTLLKAISEYVHEQVRQPLARLIFTTEDNYSLTTILKLSKDDDQQDLKEYWNKVSSELFKTSMSKSSKIIANGLECFQISRQSPMVDLQIPYSLQIMSTLNKEKTRFLGARELIIQNNENNPDQAEEICLGYTLDERNVFNTLLNNRYKIDFSNEDNLNRYVHDFVMYYFSEFGNLTDDQLIKLLKHQQNSLKYVDETIANISSPVDCHIVFWLNEQSLRDQASILQLIFTALPNKEQKTALFNSILNLSQEMSLDLAVTEEVSKHLIPTKELLENLGGLGAWRVLVFIILNRASPGSDLYSALRVCSDFVNFLLSKPTSENAHLQVQNGLIQLSEIIVENEYDVSSSAVVDEVLHLCKNYIHIHPSDRESITLFFTEFSHRCFSNTKETEGGTISILLDEISRSSSLISHPEHALKKYLNQFENILDLIEFPANATSDQYSTIQQWLLRLNNLQSPSAVLLCDLIETEGYVSQDEERYPLFENCIDILKATWEFENSTEATDAPEGYPFISICAFAYMRAALRYMAGLFSSNSKDIVQAGLPTRTDLLGQENKLVYSLRTHFLKVMRSRLSIEGIKQMCNVFSTTESLAWLKTIPWKSDQTPLVQLGYDPFFEDNYLVDKIAAMAGEVETCMRGLGNQKLEELCKSIFNENTPLNNRIETQYVLSRVVFNTIFVSYRHPKGFNTQQNRLKDFLQRTLDNNNNAHPLQNRHQVYLHRTILALLSNDFGAHSPLNLVSDSPTRLSQSIFLVRFLLFNLGPGSNSPFSQYLLNPLGSCNSMVVAAAEDETASILAAVTDFTSANVCPDGHVYTIGECGQAMEESKCPTCGAGIGGREHNLKGDNKKIEKPVVNAQPGFVKEPLDSLRPTTHSVRALPPNSYRLAHLYLNSCSLLALFLNETNNNWQAETLQFTGTAIKGELLEDACKKVDLDWGILKQRLNMSDEDIAIVSSRVVSALASNETRTLRNGLLLTSDARTLWETGFDTLCATPILNNVQAAINRNKGTTQASVGAGNTITLEQEIEEFDALRNNPVYLKQHYGLLLRTRDVPTLDALRAQLDTIPDSHDSYPLIHLGFEAENDGNHSISMMPQLKGFVDWLQLVRKKLEFKMTRSEVTSMTIQSFIDNHCGDIQDVEEKCDQFIKTWNKYCHLLDRFECEKLPPVEKVTRDSSLMVCVLESRDTGILSTAFLKMFATIQNNFLGKVVDMSARGLRALQMFKADGNSNVSLIRQISILEVEDKHLISTNLHNYVNLCYSNPNFSNGRTTHYDFERVQMGVGSSLLECKALNVKDLPTIFCFASEQFFSNMSVLATLSEIIPQDKMKPDMLTKIRNDRAIQPESALRSLDVVIYLLQRTKGDSVSTIKEYCNRFLNPQDYIGIQGTSLMSVPLNALVATYEEIESQASSKTVNSTPAKYRVEMKPSLSSEVETSIKENNIKLAHLITALNRYLFRFLSTEVKDADEKLNRFLGTCWPDPEHLEDVWYSTVPLPDSIEARHTFHLRELAVKLDHLAKQKELEAAHSSAVYRGYGVGSQKPVQPSSSSTSSSSTSSSTSSSRSSSSASGKPNPKPKQRATIY